MHPIFENRDLLDEICFWLVQRDLAVTIRLNKTWFSASIGPLWRSVELSKAFKLLGLIRRFRKDFDIFWTVSIIPGKITLDQWKRLVYYAQYVRILRVHGSDSCAISSAITSRPSSLRKELKYFFPRCQYLHWDATQKQIDAVNLGVLIPPTLDHVYLSGIRVGRIWFNKFCEILLSELSSLRAFHIDPAPLIEPVEDSDPFYSLLKKFARTLTSIQIPEILFTKATIGELSKVGTGLYDLAAQKCRYYEMPGPVLIKEHASDFDDKSGNFSCLKSLFFGPFMDQIYILKFLWEYSFPALRSFHWHILDTDFNVEALLATIVQTCPNLETLELGSWNMEGDQEASWFSIRSLLLKCTKLVTFSLLSFRVDMTLDNFVELLKSSKTPSGWRKLEILNCQRFNFQDALLLVAKYSPGIHELGLRVHDKDSVRPFGDIVPLPGKLLLPTFDNVEAQLELASQLRQAGFFFPSLTIVIFDNSVFMPDSEGPVVTLLLALCENRVRVVGDDWTFFRRVTDHMAAYYEELEYLTEEATSIGANLDLHLCR